jgi:DNA-binding NtrC family response regulator
MMGHAVVILSRRPEIAKEVRSWRLTDTVIYPFDSPSEALAKAAQTHASVFLFDATGYTRTRHVLRKLHSLGLDTDLVLIAAGLDVTGAENGGSVGEIARLAPDASAGELQGTVRRLLQLRRIRQQSGIVGRSRAVGEMLSLIAHAAPLDVNVLIQGESGTGKELVARAIHDHSPQREAPFLSLNCGAMTEGVLESELFGHARGAFTGAVSAHDGVFKRADGGTLFLDEVAEMPLGMQSRFLRALETGEFTPVGGTSLLRSDIRLVAATNRDLRLEVEAGRFRQDLYYRLHVVVITTPPLRARKEDIPVLAQTFLAQENRRHGLSVRGISRPALQILTEHSWPGNIRELRNVISSLAVIKQTGMIEAADLPDEVRLGETPLGRSRLPVPLTRDRESLEREILATTILELRTDIKQIKAFLLKRLGDRPGGAIPYSGDYVEAIPGEIGYAPISNPEGGDLQSAERGLIEAALKSAGGRRRQAAERLGISERTLYRKIKKYGL